MQLTRGEIGDLITALNQAIELNEMNVRSELPPKGARLTPEEREDRDEWQGNILVFRRLRRKLVRVENEKAR